MFTWIKILLIEGDFVKKLKYVIFLTFLSLIVIPEVNADTVRNCVSCGNGALNNIPEQLPSFIRNIVLILQLLTPVVLIGFGIYDFLKAIIASDEKIMKESQNRFIKRIIAAVLIFLAVAIVKFAFSLIPNSTDMLGCVPCFISDKDSCSQAYTCSTYSDLTEEECNEKNYTWITHKDSDGNAYWGSCVKEHGE